MGGRPAHGVAQLLRVLRRAGGHARGLVVDYLQERRAGACFRAVQDGDAFTVAVHFSGSSRSAYQLRQWLWPLEQLAASLATDGYGAAPVAVFCRTIGIATEIAGQTILPVRFGRLSRDLDAFFASNPVRVVFYVNQNLLNFQAIRYPDPAHVHLSHGESEKVSMTSNQLKAYDEIFIAGDAARERIQRRLLNLPSERLRDVGRPQLDEPIDPPVGWSADPGRRTILYAPTWEGDSPAMSYSSIARCGEVIVRSFIDAGWQVIYRPHPHTGIYDLATRTAHTRILRMLSRENANFGEGSAGSHFADLTSPHGWQHAEADACVCDMSAVAFDWITSGKPLAMMDPGPGASIDGQGVVGQISLVPPADAARLPAALATEIDSGSTAARRALASHYFGDTAPGAQIGRFVAESRRLINERTRQLTKRQQPPGD